MDSVLIYQMTNHVYDCSFTRHLYAVSLWLDRSIVYAIITIIKAPSYSFLEGMQTTSYSSSIPPKGERLLYLVTGYRNKVRVQSTQITVSFAKELT